jgi:hypothetical protein
MSAIATSASRNKLVLLSSAVGAVAVAAFVVRVCAAVTGGVGGDFAIYLNAADQLRLGLPIYPTEIDIAQNGWPYVYSPLLAQLLMPLGSAATAWPLWTALSFACWAGSVGTLLWELRARLWQPIPAEWRPVLLVGCVVWPSVILDLWLGQTQLLLLALLTAAWWCLRRDRKSSAGVLLGVAIALKPLPLVAVVVLFAARQFRAALVAGVIAALLTIVSFSFAGWDQAWVYLLQTAPAFDRFWATNPNNRSLTTTLQFLVETRLPEFTSYLFAAALVAVAASVAWWGRLSSSRALTLGVTLALLATPLLEMSYVPLALLPLALLFADGRPRQRALVSLAYLLCLLAPYVLPAPEDPAVLLFAKNGLPAAALLLLFFLQCRQDTFGRDRELRDPSAAGGGYRVGHGGWNRGVAQLADSFSRVRAWAGRVVHVGADQLGHVGAHRELVLTQVAGERSAVLPGQVFHQRLAKPLDGGAVDLRLQ